MIIPHVITDARLDHVAHPIFVLDDEVAGYDIDDVTLVAPVIAKVAGVPAALLVSVMSPVPELVALKLATALLVAGVLSVVPPMLVVVSNPVTETFLVCVMVPPAFSVAAPFTVTPLVVVVAPAPAVSTEVTEPIITAFASR